MKIPKRQLKRIIRREHNRVLIEGKRKLLKRIIREEKLKLLREGTSPNAHLYGAFDQISEDIEDMGYAFAERDIAELWLDDNQRFYHGIYIDTRPHNDGSGVPKVKIEWPEWDYSEFARG